MADILTKLQTRFDPRIVQPDELARSAHDEIERLRAALTEINEIELQEYGQDYAEIEQAQIIATAALAYQQNGDGK